MSFIREAIIGGPSTHGGGHVPPKILLASLWSSPQILEFSIGQAKNSNSFNGGTPQKILAFTLCPAKISGHGPPMEAIRCVMEAQTANEIIQSRRFTSINKSL